MPTFGENLKTLRIRSKFSQSVVAGYLGVAQNTIANYENNKRFPDGETLDRIATFFHTSIDGLMGRTPLLGTQTRFLEADACKSLTAQLIQLILEGKEKEAIQLVMAQAGDNASIFLLYEQVLGRALVDIGLMWHQGKLNTSWEHYATALLDKIMVHLSSRLNEDAQKEQSAICMSYSSDPHTTGVKMISELLRTKGYRAYYLGSNTTTNSLIEMIQQLKPTILAISVTMDYHLDGVKNLIERIKERDEAAPMTIIVGGQAFLKRKELWKKCGADGYASNFQMFQKQIDALEKPD